MNFFKKIVSTILIGGMMMSLFGCNSQKHNIDYCGDKNLYEGAKDSYRAGERVVLKYDMIATDTSYAFYLDGEPVDHDYDNGRFIISFIMPDHDAKLEVKTKNTMVYIPEIEISVINSVAPADIWILEDSEKNRKTTIWGEANITKDNNDLNKEISIMISEEESYLFRMIDEDRYFYSASNIVLNANNKLIIKEGDFPMSAILEVLDENNELIQEYELFVARL